MGKNKPSKVKPVTATESEKKTVLYLRLTPAHESALEKYISRQKAKPDRQSVGLAALESFLEQEGLWPPEEVSR